MSDRRRIGAALLALAVLIAATAACGGDPPQQSIPLTIAAQPSPQATPETTPSLKPVVADPARIRIPSIGVDAPVDKVGLKKVTKTRYDMVTPKFGRAGWYSPKEAEKPLPRPGEPGPATIVAHVDSKSGPDVFARLRELKRGDEIEIIDKNGAVYTFLMERSMQTPKDKLPGKKIFGATDGPALRLITCGGSFDRSIGHYTDNLTIFADAK